MTIGKALVFLKITRARFGYPHKKMSRGKYIMKKMR